MQHDRRSGVFLSLLMLALPAATACDTSVNEPRSMASVSQLAVLVNDHRRAVGCSPLSWDSRLAMVAQAHSDDMVRRHYFGHVNPDGKSPFDRMRDAGLSWNGPAGENLASSPRGAETVFESWLASPEHRANLERCAYTHTAIGVSQGLWTELYVANPSP